VGVTVVTSLVPDSQRPQPAHGAPFGELGVPLRHSGAPFTPGEVAEAQVQAPQRAAADSDRANVHAFSEQFRPCVEVRERGLGLVELLASNPRSAARLRKCAASQCNAV